MSNIAHPTAIARVGRTLLSRSGNPSASDDQLLGRFLDTGDADAFAGLVARHGPMVYAVSRRVMGDIHRADDAFQATFLILSRRAGDVKPRGAVRAWLYGVAVRTALTARARTGHRLKREIPVASVPDRAVPVRTDADLDVLRMLDEEIALLPDKLRAAVVLCELDGLGRKEAATRLRIAEGTLSSRLAAARKTLAARLKKRGVSVPSAALGVLFARVTTASAVPGALTEAAARYASPNLVPPGVDELTRGVFKAQFLAKLTASFAAAMLVGVLVTAALAESPSPGAPADQPLPVPVRLSLVSTSTLAPVPRPAPREGVILVTSFSKDRPAELYKPDGTLIARPAVGEATTPFESRLSPDAKRALVIQLAIIPGENSQWNRCQLFLLDLEAKEGPKESLMDDLRNPSVVWSPDGAKLYGSQVDPEKKNEAREEDKLTPMVSWVYDLKTKKQNPLPVPTGHEIVDISPDGKQLLTRTYDHKDRYWTRTYLVPLATLKPRSLTEKRFMGLRFSPDGKTVIGNLVGSKGGAPWAVARVSVKDGSEQVFKLPEGVKGIYHACWSPDGKRIAYHWQEDIPVLTGPTTWRVSRVNVADVDGGNTTTVIRRDDAMIHGLDWR
jgi:RNA polymerase sigma factor (sigma-70 family)